MNAPETAVTHPAPTDVVDVAVVGAGPVGLLSALLLARSNRTVLVLERSAELGVPPGGVVLQPGTLGLLRAVGVLDPLVAAGRPLSGVDEIAPDGSTLTADYADLADAPVTFALAVPLRALRDALLDALNAEPSVEVRVAAALTGLEQDTERVRLTTASPEVEPGTDRIVSAALVVGADGKYSTTRELAGIEAEIVAFPRPQLICRLPRPAAWPDRIRSRRGDDPFVVIPGTAESLHVFGDLPTADGPAGAGLSVLGRIVGRHDPVLGAGITERGEVVATIRHHTVRPARWTAGRVALVGDAAHTVHPYAGQGINLGLHDAVVLAAVAGTGGVAGTRPDLPAYERWRRPFVERFQRTQRSVLDGDGHGGGGGDRRSPYADDFAALALGQPGLDRLVPRTPAISAIPAVHPEHRSSPSPSPAPSVPRTVVRPVHRRHP